MSQFFQIHPENPQLRLIKQAAQIIHAGGLLALPTDSCYALVCHLDDKQAVEKLRRIRGVDEKHHLTLLCRDLSEIAQYAKVGVTHFIFNLRWPILVEEEFQAFAEEVIPAVRLQ